MAQHQRRNAGVDQGTHQEGPNARQTGQTNSRAPGDNQKDERATREGRDDTERRSENDHQKSVQGKKQHGPEDKVNRDVGGGNAGSQGQNIDERRDQDEHTGKKHVH